MNQLKSGFEAAVRSKLAQKATPTQSEEMVLMRSFKYFDTDDDGSVSLDEWFKAIEKIGIVVPSLEDLKQLFYTYDVSGDGSVDYKEFSNALYAKEKPAEKGKETEKEKGESDVGDELVTRLRDKLASRGARGIIGLGKQFKIMDDDNSWSIDKSEFKKAMRDYQLGFSESEIEGLYKKFDINRDGTINYDEFLRSIRGKMNENRKSWVRRAFKVLDKDGSGAITLSEIKQTYNAKMHPDVKAGKRTEDDVLLEFLETFETHHNVLMGKEADGEVTAEEFEEYYNNVSASIDTDEYFALMMKSAWKLDEYNKTYAKGWKGEEEAKAPKASPPKSLRSPIKRGKANMTSADSTLLTTASPQPDAAGHKTTSSAANAKKPAVEKLRKALATRGARGVLGLARQFKIADNDGSKQLDLEEFTQILKDYRVHIDDKEIHTLFTLFDKDKSGTISYDEFLRSVRGEMNSFRLGLVELAFKKLDKDGSGKIDIHDMKGVYNAKNHPDVKSGKKTEDQALGDFLETFEMHMNLGGGVNDQTITKEEFIEYYTNVSASIDDDKYFELVIVNAWKLYGEGAKKPGWAESYSKGRPATTASHSAPYGTSEEPTDYSTALRPQKKAGGEDEENKQVKGQSPAKAQIGSYSDKQLVDTFRQTLISRGTRGLLSIQRSFKVIDDDNSMTISMDEFKKVIKDYRLKFSDSDSEKLFRIFDRDNSGSIDYDEFVRAVVGEMNPFRKSFVTKAFKILDKDGSGELTVEDIKGVYSAARHPDVIARKKTEEEVLTEFLDTFEQHYALSNPGSRDAKVNMEEFTEYYNNVSASIDDDKYFELMMTNAWNLNKASYGKGWASKY